MKKTGKILKIILLSLGSIIGIVLLVAILIPIFFKDKIKSEVDQLIADKVNAEVIYKVEDISLSIISSFPDLRFSIDHLTIKNNEPFKGDTLAYVGSFQLDFALWKFVTDGVMKVNQIALHSPYIHLKTNAQQQSNYAILKDTDTTSKPAEPSSGLMNIALDKWEITDARIYYEDSTSHTYARLDQLNQIGKARIKGNVISTSVETDVPSFSASYGKVNYLNRHRVFSKIDIDIAENNSLFTLKENEIRVNDFAFFTKGFLKMQEQGGYKMDIVFASNTNSFKGVLSLVPAVYTKNFSDIQTNGAFDFSGFVKGMYDGDRKQIPAFSFVLKVRDGYFKYPSLDLPVEKISFQAQASNDGSNVDNTVVIIENMKLEVANDPIAFTATLHRLNDYTLSAFGKLNLGNLQKVYPMDDMKFSGNLDFNIHSAGKVDDVMNSKYQQLKNDGTIKANDLVIDMKNYPQVKIPVALLSFDAKNIDLKEFTSQVGKSDFKVNGKIVDYLPYIFTDNGVLKGNVIVQSNYINLNEWMSDNDEAATPTDTKAAANQSTAQSETTVDPMKPYIIPKNLDMILASKITKLDVLDMDMQNFDGKVKVKNGVVYLENTKFNLLDGSFIAKGMYSTADPKKPKVEFDMDMQSISVKKAYQTFGVVKKLAPIAEKMEGQASLVLDIVSDIGDDYLPIYSTLNGKGKLNLKGAGLKDFELLNTVASITNMPAFNNPTFKETSVTFVVKEGKLITDPFPVNIGDISSKVSGYTTMDGSVDYVMDAKIPAKDAGKYIKDLVGTDLGGVLNNVQEIPVSISFKGKYNQIKPSLVADKQKLTDALKSQVKQVVEKKKEEGKKVITEAAQEAVKSFTDPNDKRSTGEKLNNAVEQGKKKLLDLFGNPK